MTLTRNVYVNIPLGGVSSSSEYSSSSYDANSLPTATTLSAHITSIASVSLLPLLNSQGGIVSSSEPISDSLLSSDRPAWDLMKYVRSILRRAEGADTGGTVYGGGVFAPSIVGTSPVPIRWNGHRTGAQIIRRAFAACCTNSHRTPVMADLE